MERSRLSFDKTELVLVDVEAKTPTVHNLNCDDLVRFRLVPKRTFALYRFVDDEVLEFHVRGKIEPISLHRRRNKEMFSKYLEESRKFCKEQQIPFSDET